MAKHRNKHPATVVPAGYQVLDIPVDQILLDPHQPRTTFDPVALDELATSIDKQGLQQLPTVNFAYEKDGKRYYYIKAGERRYRAHQILKLSTLKCLVAEEAYDGTFCVARKLAQAAENSSREPHTHEEIVVVMEAVIKDEVEKRGDKAHGAIEIAMGRVAQAFGKSRAWAQNYVALTHLHPELRAMLDSKGDDERLNFGVARALAGVPAARQQELLNQAKGLKAKGGHSLMYQFVVRQASALREESGHRLRGRKLSDDKAVLTAAVNSLHRLAMSFVAERRSSEHQHFMVSVLGQMPTIEVDDLLHKLNEAMLTFQSLQTVVKERRTVLYAPLALVKA